MFSPTLLSLCRFLQHYLLCLTVCDSFMRRWSLSLFTAMSLVLTPKSSRRHPELEQGCTNSENFIGREINFIFVFSFTKASKGKYFGRFRTRPVCFVGPGPLRYNGSNLAMEYQI